ncbi:hypothetical protein CSB09_00890 [Candidatus Gracilibacteria bacterium]|nr:MAG: hypothetical protein CSB09_00890 [Candidatus Gracilibacteria bacterium]
MQAESNYAFIDGQNLRLSIQAQGWKLDIYRFRTYLKEKFKVQKAYYFLGIINEELQDLYSDLQDAGFIVVFREHHQKMDGKKKGNVDTDIVFEMMRHYAENNCDGIVLVSGDGDYIKPVKYFIQKKKLKKILFPSNKYSSLYKTGEFRSLGMNLSNEAIRKKLVYKK